MIGLTYMAGLLLAIGCLVLVDRHYSLAFFYDAKRTFVTLLVAIVVFILWDISGIVLGIFLSGDTKYATGIMLGPHFPIEELLFLIFFCYLTLTIYRFGEKR